MWGYRTKVTFELESICMFTRLRNPVRIIVSNKFGKILACMRESYLPRLMHVSYRWCCVSDEMSAGDYNVNKSFKNFCQN